MKSTKDQTSKHCETRDDLTDFELGLEKYEISTLETTSQSCFYRSQKIHKNSNSQCTFSSNKNQINIRFKYCFAKSLSFRRSRISNPLTFYFFNPRLNVFFEVLFFCSNSFFIFDAEALPFRIYTTFPQTVHTSAESTQITKT